MAHDGLAVKQIDGAFDEDRALHALASGGERLLQGRLDVPHAPDLVDEFYMRRNYGPLIDILERAASLKQRRGRASENHEGRLGELRVLERGHGVGDAWASRHSGDPRRARQPRDGVGCEHRRGLAPRVDDANALRFCAGENGRDMPAAQCEDRGYAVRRKCRRNPVTSMPRGFGPRRARLLASPFHSYRFSNADHEGATGY